MLRGRNLIVLRLGGNPQLPQFLIHVLHISAHPFQDRAEIMVIHFLAFRRHGAK